jgi:ribose transport system substrate-binding protein
MKKKLLAVSVSVAALALTMVGCGTQGTNANNTSNSSQSNGKHFTIEFIPGLTTDPFYISMERGVQDEAKKLGINVIVQGASQWSYQLQTPVVRSAIANKPDFLLIAPDDANAMIGPLTAVHNAGIPIITVDTTINDQSILVSRITSDNVQGGKAAADAMAKLMGYSGDVAVLNNAPGITTSDDRQNAFIAEMKDKYPNIKVVGVQYTNDSQNKASADTKDMLAAHPNLKGIFAANLYNAVGAAEAFQAMGKKGVLISYDAEPEEVADVANGTIQALVVQKPYQEGVLAVQYAYDYLTGNKQAIKDSVVIPNVIATKDNLNDPSINKWFYVK